MDVTAGPPQRRKTTRLERRAVASLLAGGETIDDALEAILSSAAATTGADVAIARVLEPATGSLVARSCATASAALATEVEGTRFPVDQLTEDEAADPADAGARRPEPCAGLRERPRRRTGRSLRRPLRCARLRVQEVGCFHRSKYGHC